MSALAPLTLLRPLYLLSLSLAYIPPTILTHLLHPSQFRTLLSWSSFQDAWFGRFWAFFGPRSRENAAPTVEPLVRNTLSQLGHVAVKGGGEGKGKGKGNVILDLGPGNGQWLYLFANLPVGISKIYGVEPNRSHHASLRAAISRHNLDGVYEILPFGAQDLIGKNILAPESVDAIVTLQVLCSVPEPRDVVASLYPLLKKGGRWILYEHVRTKFTGDFVRLWQGKRAPLLPFFTTVVKRGEGELEGAGFGGKSLTGLWLTLFVTELINLVWPVCFGGCSITRPTDEWLLTAGEWSDVNLKPGEGEGKYDTIPHVLGTLVK
ncbi:hypothetical protein M8818_000478 [Zalaria obscura]|uniref:Uncharacterized protein n=1 Tax=Zalaria obscura TaxID=2024903 RepID=A0ACC3SNN3_9PEZI